MTITTARELGTPQLTLTVTNPIEVGIGSRTTHQFCDRGGSIGTATSDSWQLSSHRTGVIAGHAEIRLIDGVFCLIDRSGRTFINSANQPVGRGRRARLSSGDTVAIGRYQLHAQVNRGEGGNVNADFLSETDDALIHGDELALRKGNQNTCAEMGREPLQQLGAVGGDSVSVDPVATLGITDEYREHRDVALNLPVKMQRNNSTSPDSAPTTAAYNPEPTDAARQHISAAPLLRGMASPLSFDDSDALRLFMEEAGQTLKATIEGLLALHQHEDSRHQALRTRLQPIEDNPLRLGQNYEATVQTLFASQRSPVHLSAPAAVSESLAGLRQHQQATQVAIGEALDAILHAFSPEALLRRFHGYRRGLQENEPEAEWAWQMYEHYYRELSSSRQQGFERLFQEVFEQAYDHQLRELQRESLL